MKNLKEKALSFYYKTGASILSGPGLFKDKGMILMYHRVLPDTEAFEEEASLAVSVSNFRSQIKYLSENFNCISLDDIEQSLKEESFFVAITFDDGYLDNLVHALPILEEFNVPAVIYVTTRFLEGDASMWWYEIPDFLKSKSSHHFSWKGNEFFFDLSTTKSKVMAYKKIRKLLINLPYVEQKCLMEAFRGRKEKQYLDKVLDINSLRELANSKLITIGAHTHNHPVLKNESVEVIREEIEKSRTILETALGRKIHHFAYPFGHLSHAGPREYSIAKNLKFKTSVTTISRPFLETEDLHALPRMAVTKRNTVQHLHAKLNGWNFLLGDFQA